MNRHYFTSIYDMRKFSEEIINSPDRLEFHGWTETFSSTSGPCGGIGGQAMTSFDVIAFVCPLSGKAILFCSNVWKKVNKFNNSWHHSK